MLTFLKDAAVAISVSIALVLIAELVLRAFFPQRLKGIRLQGQHFSVPDEMLGMRYVPGATWRFNHPEYQVEYAINADGFRDAKEHPVPKPSGTVRVLLLGDSFTFGMGVNYEDTWPVQVERELERSGELQIDLVKAGVQGMDTRSEFFLMRRLVKKYDVDVIVVGFLINDLYSNSLNGVDQEQPPSSASGDNDPREDSGESWLRTMTRTYVRNDGGGTSHLVNLLQRTLLANDLLYCKAFLMSASGDFMREPWTPAVSRQMKMTENLFNKMQEYAEANDKKLIVLSIPQQFQVLYLHEYGSSHEVRAFDDCFSNFATQRGFVWITSLESFAQAQGGPARLFHRWDGHLTPAGNQVVAQVFLQQIAPFLISAGNTP